MKKLFALLLALAMVFSLAACGGGDDDKPPSNDDKTPSSSQQQEQNTPDPGTDEPDNSGEATDPATSGNAGGSAVADANAWLAERGFEGFTLPEDLTVDKIGMNDMPAAMLAIFCPVENAKYEEVLQALFSDTGMAVETTGGIAATSLDDCLSTISTDDMVEHKFNYENENWYYTVTVNYFRSAFDNGSVVYDAQTMSINVNCVPR